MCCLRSPISVALLVFLLCLFHFDCVVNAQVAYARVAHGSPRWLREDGTFRPSPINVYVSENTFTDIPTRTVSPYIEIPSGPVNISVQHASTGAFFIVDQTYNFDSNGTFTIGVSCVISTSGTTSSSINVVHENLQNIAENSLWLNFLNLGCCDNSAADKRVDIAWDGPTTGSQTNIARMAQFPSSFISSDRETSFTVSRNADPGEELASTSHVFSGVDGYVSLFGFNTFNDNGDSDENPPPPCLIVAPVYGYDHLPSALLCDLPPTFDITMYFEIEGDRPANLDNFFQALAEYLGVAVSRLNEGVPTANKRDFSLIVTLSNANNAEYQKVLELLEAVKSSPQAMGGLVISKMGTPLISGEGDDDNVDNPDSNDNDNNNNDDSSASTLQTLFF